MNITAQGLALIIGIDRLLDMVRTCVNVIGNALSTVVIAKWENVYDKERSKLLKFNLKIYIFDLEPLTIYDCKWLLCILKNVNRSKTIYDCKCSFIFKNVNLKSTKMIFSLKSSLC